MFLIRRNLLQETFAIQVFFTVLRTVRKETAILVREHPVGILCVTEQEGTRNSVLSLETLSLSLRVNSQKHLT